MNRSSKESKTLKTLIKEANLTQREFSIRVQITERVLSKWERGETSPTLAVAVRIARELNIPLKRLCLAMGIPVEGVPDDLPPETEETQE